MQVVFRSSVKSQCGFGSADSDFGLVSHSTINLSSSVNLQTLKKMSKKRAWYLCWTNIVIVLNGAYFWAYFMLRWQRYKVMVYFVSTPKYFSIPGGLKMISFYILNSFRQKWLFFETCVSEIALLYRLLFSTMDGFLRPRSYCIVKTNYLIKTIWELRLQGECLGYSKIRWSQEQMVSLYYRLCGEINTLSSTLLGCRWCAWVQHLRANVV